MKKIINSIECWYLYLKIRFYLYPILKKYEEEDNEEYIKTIRYRWLNLLSVYLKEKNLDIILKY